MPNILKHLLYIEDDEGLARLLQKRLERHRFAVDVAYSAEIGMERLKQNTYDLVLMDYHLPGMNGLEALQYIVKMEQSPPVILLTASGDEQLAVCALENGAADYAVKDAGQSYFDLLPAVMQAAFTREKLLRENERQREELSVAKEKAEAASQAKSNFLAMMSHEIRTPLNVVIGLTAMLSKSKLDENQAKILSTLSSNADLLLKLINDLLDISRIEAGQVKLECNAFSFSSVMADIKAMFEEQARQKKIALIFHENDAVVNAYGDRRRIQQILMNLVSNAIKFTNKGSVEVSGESRNEEENSVIRFTVKDTGIGIPQDKIPTIFDKFTQADETITRRYGGSGLGLCIAYSLAKMMDGDIGVTSEPDKGSEFTATIRLKQCYPESNKEAIKKPMPTPDPSPAHLDKAVLLVEDYDPNVMVATMMLEDLGYEVTVASSGSEAIAAVLNASRPFRAILMDVQMQDMDGLETTRRIRELENGLGISNTIIGVTAHALAGDRERCISSGMDDYISKPIHPDILATKLKNTRPLSVSDAFAESL